MDDLTLSVLPGGLRGRGWGRGLGVLHELDNLGLCSAVHVVLELSVLEVLHGGVTFDTKLFSCGGVLGGVQGSELALNLGGKIQNSD